MAPWVRTSPLGLWLGALPRPDRLGLGSCWWRLATSSAGRLVRVAGDRVELDAPPTGGEPTGRRSAPMGDCLGALEAWRHGAAGAHYRAHLAARGAGSQASARAAQVQGPVVSSPQPNGSAISIRPTSPAPAMSTAGCRSWGSTASTSSRMRRGRDRRRPSRGDAYTVADAPLEAPRQLPPAATVASAVLSSS